MGNTCACLGGGTSLSANRRKNSSEPHITSLHQQDGNNALPLTGGYKKTAVSAKYEAPSGQGANQSGLGFDDPELNLNPQMPVLDEQEVKAFFVDARQEERDSYANGSNCTPNGDKMTDDRGTHIEVFSLDKSLPNSAKTAKPERVGGSSSKTHVTVFNLDASGREGQRTDATTEKTERATTVHIDMTALVGEQSSQQRIESRSGTDNLGFVSKEGDLPNLATPPSSSQKNTDRTSGVTNFGFISDEPSDNKSEMSEIMTSLNDDNQERLDENTFFFGMESLKFDSQPTGACADKLTDECHREISEIVSDIHTIEDRMCSRLRRHTQETDHTQFSITTIGEGKDNNLYEDVLNNLKDVCLRVEDVLRKKGVAVDSGISDDWLSLPDLNVVNQKYKKETRDTQTATVNKLLEATKSGNDHKVQEILDEYKRTQERLMRMREIERRRLLENLDKKIAARRQETSSHSRDEEDEKMVLESQYSELMKNSDSNEEEDVVVDDNSNSSYSYSELDVESTNILKKTLTHDIQSRMTQMTSSDFGSIMDIYRKERSSIRNKGDSERPGLKQSLWEKLEERRRHVDQSIHEGLLKINETGGSETSQETTNKDCDNRCDAPTATKSCLVNPSLADAATEIDEDLTSLLAVDQSVGITEQELTLLTRNVLSDTLNKGHNNDIVKQDVERLLKTHFDNLNKFRLAKESSSQQHHENILEKLKNRKEKQQARDVEEFEKAVKEADEEFQQKGELLQKQCLEGFGQRQLVTQIDVERALNQFRQSQQALNQHHIHQRSLLKQRLQDKLAARRKRPRGQDTDLAGDEDQRTPIEAHPRQMEQKIRAMDEEFYESLLSRKRRGEITEGELAQLIDEHLNNVDEFRKNIKKHLSQRRRERRQELSKEEMAALVELNKANQEQVQLLRRNERDKVENKLKEKLRKKKTGTRANIAPSSNNRLWQGRDYIAYDWSPLNIWREKGRRQLADIKMTRYTCLSHTGGPKTREKIITAVRIGDVIMPLWQSR
ncbi:hypothetical protein LSH36_333g03050 [Paralvinella palmiformis]|uniref:Uncharacterized protein n=1 Tax=Paralvinella palmiformis TaxID=53620 RepID=A0AAD9JG15_9ANNE|nr:hypothetical protein LSH36_333g03050 [Paralvinella palmiformis]